MKHLYLAFILFSLLAFTGQAGAALLEYQFIFSGPVYGGNSAMAVGTITIDSDMIANPGRNIYDPSYLYTNYGLHADGMITALTVTVTGATGGVGDGTFDLTNFDAVLFDTSLLALDLTRQITGQPTASSTGMTWGEDDPIEASDPPQMYTGDFQLFAAAGSGAPHGIYPYQIGANEGNIDGMQLIAFGPVGLTVTTATVASSLNPSTSGQSVTFTATVTPAAAAGTVIFKEGSAILGTGTLNNGTATYSASSLSVGDHRISAVYSGDGSYLGATSPTITQTMNSSQTSITVATTPVGRTITVDGTDYTAPQTFSWTPGGSHTIAVASPQPGSSGSRYAFTSWSDSGDRSHGITTPDTTATYTATFGAQYQLTTVAGTSGAVLPTSGNWYNAGMTPNIIATAGSGYAFSSWSLTNGSGPILHPNNSSTTVAMNGPTTVTANFQALPLTLRAAIGTATGATGGIRTWPIIVTNNGAFSATGVQFTGVTLSSSGSCKPVATTTFPVSLGDIAPTGTATGNVTIDFSSCNTAKLKAIKFSVVIGYSATNGGGVTGTLGLSGVGQ